MKLSTKTRYGLRILLQIASDSDGKKFVQGKDIAKNQEITEAYLEQIMISLKNARLVKTTRGCKGGYALARDPSEIKLIDIVELFEGPIFLADCVEDETYCSMLPRCKAHHVWKKLSGEIRSSMQKINLKDIALTSSPNEYSI